MKTYLQQLGHFLLLVLVVQIARSFIITGLWKILQPAPDSPIWAIMDMVAFGLVGIGLFVFLHPSRRQLGLDWKTAHRWEIFAYVGIGVLALGLVISTYLLQADLFTANLNAAIVIPIFEELLFRGWGWNQLETVATFKGSHVVNWLVMSFLFGLWHFGYLDIYVLKMAPSNPGLDWGNFFLMKFLTTLVIGLIVGIPRWRTGRVYGSLILHSLINLFGR